MVGKESRLQLLIDRWTKGYIVRREKIFHSLLVEYLVIKVEHLSYGYHAEAI